LAEKAYVEANAIGLVTSSHVGTDSYDALNNGYPSWALQAITGKSAGDYGFNSGDVASAWNAGKLVVLNTAGPASSYIVGGHSYALVGYNPSSGIFDVFNPWGTDSSGWAPGYSGKVYGLFWADANFLSANFSGQSVGSGAAPGGCNGGHAASSQQMADLALGAGVLGPHRKTASGGVATA